MKNHLVLVVGGTSGIGLSTAKYLSDKGYQVIACGRRQVDSENIVFEQS
jgi:Short-chain dehydrogenase involved in D-alanine esterification of lipoteichoic acid and wall teichoic acid (D-alanine transfer protein)